MRLFLSMEWYFSHEKSAQWLDNYLRPKQVFDRYLLIWPLSFVRLP